jgi:hypothetical protein
MVGKSIRMGKNAASKDMILGVQEKKAREKKDSVLRNIELRRSKSGDRSCECSINPRRRRE